MVIDKGKVTLDAHLDINLERFEFQGNGPIYVWVLFNTTLQVSKAWSDCSGQVRGIETTTTFDASNEEFIIDTPCESAQKYWIGGAAKVPIPDLCLVVLGNSCISPIDVCINWCHFLNRMFQLMFHGPNKEFCGCFASMPPTQLSSPSFWSTEEMKASMPLYANCEMARDVCALEFELQTVAIKLVWMGSTMAAFGKSQFTSIGRHQVNLVLVMKCHWGIQHHPRVMLQIGLHGRFDKVRIPRENLLNAVADVTADGVYRSAIKDPDQVPTATHTSVWFLFLQCKNEARTRTWNEEMKDVEMKHICREFYGVRSTFAVICKDKNMEM